MDVDFFDVSLFGHQLNRWPVFNVADAAVTIGVVLLIIFHRRVISPEQTAGADVHVPTVDPGASRPGSPDSQPPGNPD